MEYLVLIHDLLGFLEKMSMFHFNHFIPVHNIIADSINYQLFQVSTIDY